MEVSTEQLKALFNQDIIDLYKRMIKLVKHKPTRLMDYINKYGGYEAAVKYISTESNVQDFAVLWEKERLDLSVEALITRQPYRVLFDDSILKFCDKKLKEYSYAPNKIKEVPEPTGYVEEEKIDLAKLLKDKEQYLPEIKQKDYIIYNQNVSISKEDWKALLTNIKVVTVNNLDLLLRIYEIGDEVGPKELSQEVGYSSTYPYKEVVTALGKRIKSKLHIDVPVSQDGKSMFWHILFNGGIKDNTAFEWSLKNNLRQAIKELIQEGVVKEVTVNHKKQLKTITEATIEEATTTKEEDKSTAFDKLFEAIMTPTKEVEKESIEETTKESVPIIEKEPIKEEIEMSIKPINEQHDSIASIDETISKMDYKERIKKECIEYYGAICDLCGFDFGYTYGEQYENYIEVYNIHGVEGEIIETTDPKEDLIPVCCNCYRVIHSQKPPISVEQMRKMIKV